MRTCVYRAKLIKHLIEKSGLDHNYIEKETQTHLWDLEQFDEDISLSPSLSQVNRLAQLLGVSMRDILRRPEDPPPSTDAHVTWDDLVNRSKSYIEIKGTTFDQFCTTVGWDLSNVWQNSNALWRLPADTILDWTAVLGIPWIHAIPPSTSDVPVEPGW